MHASTTGDKKQYAWRCSAGHQWRSTVTRMITVWKSNSQHMCPTHQGSCSEPCCAQCHGFELDVVFPCGHYYALVSRETMQDTCPSCINTALIKWQVETLRREVPPIFRADLDARIAYWTKTGWERESIEEMNQTLRQCEPSIDEIAELLKWGRPHYILQCPYWPVPFAKKLGLKYTTDMRDEVTVLESLRQLLTLDVSHLSTAAATKHIRSQLQTMVRQAQWAKKKSIYREVRFLVPGPSGRRALRSDFIIMRRAPLPHVVIEVDSDAAGRSTEKLAIAHELGAIAVQVVFKTKKPPKIAQGVHLVHIAS